MQLQALDGTFHLLEKSGLSELTLRFRVCDAQRLRFEAQQNGARPTCRLLVEYWGRKTVKKQFLLA